eukprot:7318887-Prymnesium_polylepis.1
MVECAAVCRVRCGARRAAQCVARCGVRACRQGGALVPPVVIRNSRSRCRRSNSMYVCCCHVGPSSHDAGSSGSDSVPTFCCCVSTPAARRPTSAGMKIRNADAVICANVTPQPRSSTTASMKTRPESITAVADDDCASAYVWPRPMK